MKYQDEIKEIRKQINISKGIIEDKEEEAILNPDQIKILDEVKGIAAFKYANVIEEIYNYVNNMIKGKVIMTKGQNFLKCDKQFSCSIPKEITSKIDFIKDLVIVIDANPYKEGVFGNGNTDYSSDNKIVKDGNGTYKPDKMRISAVIFYDQNSGNIFKNALTSILYHELNHVNQLYQTLLNNKDKYQTAGQITSLPSTQGRVFLNGYVEKYIFTTNTDRDKQMAHELNMISYLLLTDGERNSAVASVYGELKGLGKRYNSIEEGLRDSKYFLNYQNIANNIYWFINNLTDFETNKIRYYFEHYSNLNIAKDKSPYVYRTKLLKYLNERSKSLFTKICRAVQLYIDQEKDIKELNETISWTSLDISAVNSKFTKNNLENSKKLWII